jgi:dihydrolipoamide dehydrogenase
VLNSRQLLQIDKLPDSMIVIGASVVGVEFASIFSAFGTRVTLLGRRTFLKDAESQLAKRFQRILRRKGVIINIGLSFGEIVPTDEGLMSVTYEQKGEERQAEAEIVLLSTGRWPYVDGVGLGNVGIAQAKRAIDVNEYLETSVPGIYAIGDCIGGYLLAHVASYEGEVAAENALGHRRAVDYSVVPNCIFTMPEIAGVGLTERQSREMGLDYIVSRFPFNANSRALAIGEPDGQIRLICERRGDGKGGRVLGMHIMGPHASELIAEGALAMRMGASAEDIAETMHQHPTLAEAVMEVAKGQLDGAIHYHHR